MYEKLPKLDRPAQHKITHHAHGRSFSPIGDILRIRESESERERERERERETERRTGAYGNKKSQEV